MTSFCRIYRPGELKPVVWVLHQGGLHLQWLEDVIQAFPSKSGDSRMGNSIWECWQVLKDIWAIPCLSLSWLASLNVRVKIVTNGGDSDKISVQWNSSAWQNLLSDRTSFPPCHPPQVLPPTPVNPGLLAWWAVKSNKPFCSLSHHQSCSSTRTCRCCRYPTWTAAEAGGAGESASHFDTEFDCGGEEGSGTLKVRREPLG